MSVQKHLQQTEAWQAARVLMQHIFQISKIGALAEDQTLKNELHQAAIQVTTELAETTCTHHKKQLDSRFSNAIRYCIKAKSLLYLLEDIGYLPSTLLLECHDKADTVIECIQESQLRNHYQFRLGFLLIQF